MANKTERMTAKEFLTKGLSFDRKNTKSKRIEMKTKDSKMSLKDFNENFIGGDDKKKSKFNSKITYVDGIMFHSAWEAKRYSVLKIMERMKEITELKLQVPYKIIINDVLVTKYIADFVYMKDGVEVVEDAKGFITPEYAIKKNLMKAVLGIEIFETTEKKKRYTRRPKK